ncbi:NAD-dependent epimerase/dehydratase family protein [Paenibacillus periandrae]|uniref:NAD-dependent epimerase/dehydratase family protein n=1 Tax=Paenibacillus periandrae TaxID=1761741 RepID=UPI001F093362|nr:NAD-dependent epimerase/dehydratase family protein [Paenibacillus periandrae]
MKLFITGITGYIGAVLAEHLVAQGVEVYGLVRTDEQAAGIQSKNVHPIVGDMSNISALLEGVTRTDGVIHTAIAHTADSEALDTLAVATMLKAMEGSDNPFIYTSGTLIYNDTNQHTVNEESPLQPLPFLEWKAQQELTVLQAAQRRIRTIVIRPSLVYGLGGGLVKGSIQLARHLQAANYIGDGHNAWSTIHVEDLADLYAKAVASAAAGSLFNAASREMVTMQQLMAAISRITGLEKRLQSWTLEEATHILGPFAWASSINQRISGLKAEQQLNWKSGNHSILQDIEFGSYPAAQ